MVKIGFNKKGIKLYNADCFDVFPKIKDKSIDLFVLDLPYGQTACAWDTCIDLEKMWIQIKRIMKPSAILCFFCTTKFGYSLIKSNEKWFKYDLIFQPLIWQKSRKVGFLSANKRQLRNHENIYVFKHKQGSYNPQKIELDKVDKRNRQKDKEQNIVYGENVKLPTESTYKHRHPTSIIEHENIYVFNNDDNHSKDDKEIKRNIELRKYAEKVKEYINKPLKQITKDIGNMGLHHFYAFKSSQFEMLTEKTYKKLIELYKIDKMKGFLKYKDMFEKWEKNPISTYNPQKTEGEPYILNKVKEKDADLYGKQNGINYKRENKGDRHPTSIIEHENIYVFNNDNNDDIELKQKHQIRQNKGNIELRKYAEKVKEYINKTKTDIVKECGQGIDHFLRISSSQFALPIEKNYKKLIELYKIDKMKGFLKFKDMLEKWEKIQGIPAIPHTYNPQKTEGKPYKTGESDLTNSYYRDNKSNYKSIANDNKGDRHPTSIIENTILKYNNPHKTIHRTEKPIGLLEYLIKTYSNEGDTVMDFCAGSLSCGMACYNTKRKFIGVEMDKTNYDLGLNRIKEHIEK